jgi:hypothetical protein
MAAVPALLRTAINVHRRKRGGQPPTIQEKTVLFAASLVVVVLAAMAAAIAFFLVCTASFVADISNLAPVVAGFSGLLTFYGVMKSFAAQAALPKSYQRQLLAIAVIAICVGAGALWLWFRDDF